jgi:hypothetical protein
MTYITNASAIILLLSNGEKVRVEKTDKNYAKILKTFELPKDEQESAVKEIINPISKIYDKGFVITGDNVTFRGESLPKALVDKVISIVRDGLPIEHFEKFWENLRENPSYHVVNETGFYDFLDYKELPITEDGCFMAYRGVGQDYWSLSGDPETKVLQGTTNERGQIYNGIGEVIEVVRNGVCDDRNVHCAAKSLHIGSIDYARNWGPKIILVKVNPKDVVSVPNDCNCQKCRICKYEVVGDFIEEITSSVVDSNCVDNLVGDIPPDTSSEDRDRVIEKVAKYLENKSSDGFDQVTVRQIQNSFSPYWPSKESILDALQELWYDWTEEDGVIVVSID